MKFLLVAINAKYIHSNLAVYSLKAFAEKYGNNNEICSWFFMLYLEYWNG